MFQTARRAATTLLKRPKSLLHLFLIDLLFLIFFVGVLRLLASKVTSFSASARLAILFILIYVGAAIVIYSIAKFFALGKMATALELHSKVDLKKLFALNGMLFLIIFLILIIASLFSQSVREPYTAYASAFFLGFFLLFAYLFMACAHSFFLFHSGILAPLKNGIRNIFSLYPLLLVFILFMLPIIALFLVSGFILGKTVFADVSGFSRYYDLYLMVFGIFVSIALYLAVFFNRFFAFELLREKVKQGHENREEK